MGRRSRTLGSAVRGRMSVVRDHVRSLAYQVIIYRIRRECRRREVQQSTKNDEMVEQSEMQSYNIARAWFDFDEFRGNGRERVTLPSIERAAYRSDSESRRMLGRWLCLQAWSSWVRLRLVAQQHVMTYIMETTKPRVDV